MSGARCVAAYLALYRIVCLRFWRAGSTPVWVVGAAVTFPPPFHEHMEWAYTSALSA